MTKTPVPDVESEPDACAMIARCHDHQHPEQHGRPPNGPLFTMSQAEEIAPMITDSDHGGTP
jgi:hypothetical protein